MHHVQFTLLPVPTEPVPTEQDALLERQRELSGWRILEKMEGEFYCSFERKRERLRGALVRAERLASPSVIKDRREIAYPQAA